MEGGVRLNRGIGWWGDGPIFEPVDAEPLPFVVDGVTRWAEVPTVRYEFDTMAWVPEPSTLTMVLIGLVALGILRIGRQTTEARG